MRLLHVECADIHNRGTVTIERDPDSGIEPITLTIHALPPTYGQDAEKEVPSPKPPRLGLSRNKKGMLDKDEQNRPIMLYDDDDPEYLFELREVQQLQAMKMIVDAMDPGEVQFETTRDGMPPRKYYEAIRGELIKYGFSLGDYVNLVKAISRVSNLKEEDVAAARLDFFEMPDSRRRSSSGASAGKWAGDTPTGQPSPKTNEPTT